MDELYSRIEQDNLFPKPYLSGPQLSASQLATKRPYTLYDTVCPPHTKPGCMIMMQRDRATGEYTTPLEVEVSSEVDQMGFARASGRPLDYASGSSSQGPFLPGGVDPKSAAIGILQEQINNSDGELFTVPDGFDRGLFAVADIKFADETNGIDLAMDRYGVDDAENDQGDNDQLAGVGISESRISADREDEKVVDQIILESKATANPTIKQSVVPKREWAHVVDVSAGFANFSKLVPRPAKEFPFELDVFQKRAVYHLERGDSVFVAAHTSAGKTVVAEYAIALSQMHITKTIYTSPIKALSNQKFRDFTKTFGEDNIGIITGDVKIRPEAPCLIMTTEVLKNMLYRGADILRDVEFVVFDECHYINDIERGVVWEEVIIMLPKHVSIILLSATVPNTREFAEWVGRTKKRDIYVINTPKRPVPLEHYLYVGKNKNTDKEMMKVVDQHGNFNSREWRDAWGVVNKPTQVNKSDIHPENKRRTGPQPSKHSMKAVGKRTAERQGITLWVHLVGFLRKQNLLPAVIFTFSRKKCEEYAHSLQNLDFLNESTRSEVHVFIDRCLKRLKPEDRSLPQVEAIRGLLKRGIGVHHSGLLPIIKEIVELLFARGFTRCLFATETFAMGVNMPARCVVFSSLRKHDGRSFRELLPGEYTQMAGRAGRRGLDSTGVVIINAVNEVPDSVSLHTMMLGSATKLESQFRLTYTMILNLLRAKQLRVEEVIKRSFGENTAQGQAYEREEQFILAKKRLEKLSTTECHYCESDLSEYYHLACSIKRLTTRLYMNAMSRSPATAVAKRSTQVFCTGRLVLVSRFPKVALGVLHKTATSDKSQVYCLLLEDPGKSSSPHVPPYPITNIESAINDLDLDGEISCVYSTIHTSDIIIVLNSVVKLGPAVSLCRQDNKTQKILPPSVTDSVYKELTKFKEYPENIEYPWKKMRELETQELIAERSHLIISIENFNCWSCPKFADHYIELHRHTELQNEVDELAIQLSDQSLDLLPDYRVRFDVLRDLGYVDEMGNVQLKGRVACEMTSADELVLTELILDNTLAQYEPEEIVALISCFVCTEKNEPEGLLERLPPVLSKGRERVLDTARRIGSIQVAYGLPISVEEYLREFKFGLVEVAYEWARGLSFKNITSLTETQEGIIVRCILRIDDVLKNIMSASFIVGDTELKLKLQTASDLIRRDIVFAASLYF